MRKRTLAACVLFAFLLVLCPASSAVQAASPAVERAIPREELLETARGIIGAARYCGLVTVDDSGQPQVRTIDPFAPDKDMVIWFATNPKTRKVGQIEKDDRVALYYFDPQSLAYVTVIGTARLVNDAIEKKQRWKEGWEAFYPDRGDSYLLVEVTPDRLEVVSTKMRVIGDSATWTPPIVEFRPRKPLR